MVVEVSRDRLELDDGSSFEIGSELQSFSTFDASAAPVLGRKGHYVHIGVDGDRLVWIAGIGAVVAGPPDVVYYGGRLVAVDGDRLVFRDGTVLTASPDLPDVEDDVGSDAQAVIDVETRTVVELGAT